MEKNIYWEKGYQQGLKDGKNVKSKKEVETIVKDICAKYSAEYVQQYVDGWQSGFSKTLMDSINKLRKKAGLDLVE